MSEQEAVELLSVAPTKKRMRDGELKKDYVIRLYEAEKALHLTRIELESTRAILAKEREALRNVTVWTLIRRAWKGGIA